MIGADGAMTVLLKDALQPNVVQTLENTLAIIHGEYSSQISHMAVTPLWQQKQQ